MSGLNQIWKQTLLVTPHPYGGVLKGLILFLSAFLFLSSFTDALMCAVLALPFFKSHSPLQLRIQAGRLWQIIHNRQTVVVQVKQIKQGFLAYHVQLQLTNGQCRRLSLYPAHYTPEQRRRLHAVCQSLKGGI